MFVVNVFKVLVFMFDVLLLFFQVVYIFDVGFNVVMFVKNKEVVVQLFKCFFYQFFLFVEVDFLRYDYLGYSQNLGFFRILERFFVFKSFYVLCLQLCCGYVDMFLVIKVF